MNGVGSGNQVPGARRDWPAALIGVQSTLVAICWLLVAGSFDPWLAIAH
jgi:hypothetical protein